MLNFIILSPMLMTSHTSIESHASQEKSAIDTFSLMASTYASFSQGLLAYSFLPTCNQHSRTCTTGWVLPCKRFAPASKPRHTADTTISSRKPATAPARPPNRSPAPVVTGRFHRSNPLGQKARGPLRPRILYRGRDQSRADPRPAGVRISLPKQRPKRGERLW